MNFALLPRAIHSVRSLSSNVKVPETSATSVMKMEKEEATKPSRKEAEKKVSKISSEKERAPVDMLIEGEPSRKEVYEYFKDKVEYLNAL